MKRISKTYCIENVSHFQNQTLHFTKHTREVIFLNSNHYTNRYSSYHSIIAFDAISSIETDFFNAFEKLNEYQKSINDWLFGYLTYDLKNDVEALQSSNHDGLQFKDLCFFQPKKILFFTQNTVEFHYLNCVAHQIEEDYQAIINTTIEDETTTTVEIEQRISKEDYLQKVNKVKQHIQQGDIYEANFCMEFYAQNAHIAPIDTYWKLNSISAPPFSVFLKYGSNYAISASPERYLKRMGNKIISQPIKGTAKRGSNAQEDQQLIHQLKNNPKEQSENIMIVDLVRNDLSITATRGSVEVEELCQVYTFPQVHQMISTVVSQVETNTSGAKILSTTFPMGSMTGAPKISAMKIIEEVEETKRGLYSGAIGYFAPNNDFDFNVVIRTILYNQTKGYVSFSVGSAITTKALAQDEYNECMIKANAMIKVLRNEK